jgi:integrase
MLRRLVRNISALTGRNDLLAAVGRPPRAIARSVIANPGEVDKLLAVSENWLRTIILLAYHAGMRRTDAMRCAPIHWNPETKMLTLEQQKTRRQLTIPATEQLASWLNHSPEGDPQTPFYILHRRAPISHRGLSQAWMKAKQRAGVNRDLWLHDLRRTVAVSLYEVSKDLRVVEQMLGHTSLASTIHYLEHRDPTKLKPYMDAIFKPRGPVQ